MKWAVIKFSDIPKNWSAREIINDIEGNGYKCAVCNRVISGIPYAFVQKPFENMFKNPVCSKRCEEIINAI
jgi:hypothetical protein